MFRGGGNQGRGVRDGHDEYGEVFEENGYFYFYFYFWLKYVCLVLILFVCAWNVKEVRLLVFKLMSFYTNRSTDRMYNNVCLHVCVCVVLYISNSQTNKTDFV